MSDVRASGSRRQNTGKGKRQDPFEGSEDAYDRALAEAPPTLCPQRSVDLAHLSWRPNNLGPADKCAKYQKKSKSSRTLPRVNDLIHNWIKTDVMIQIDSFCFSCHVMVLREFSRFFRETDPRARSFQLDQNKVTPQSFVLLYMWMVGANLNMKREGYLELFKAAAYLDVPYLENQFWGYFDNASHFHDDRAFVIYLDARGHGMEWVQKLMLSRVSNCFLKVVASAEFEDMPPWAVCALLQSDCIAVNTEMEVFMAALRWLMQDWQRREEYAVAVLEAVRFNALPLSFLMWLIKCKDTPQLQRIVNSQEIQPRIYKGLGYIELTLYYHENGPVFASKLKENGWKKPKPRQFVFDAKCAYHTPENNRTRKPMTVAEFDKYLDQLSGKVHVNGLCIGDQ